MSNVLGDTTRQQLLALGRLGWTLSRIQQSTGVRRETVSGNRKAAGIPVRGRGRPSESTAKPAISQPPVSIDPGPAKPAISEEVSTDSAPVPRPGRAPSANRTLVYELATARFVAQREDVLFLGPPGTGKSHLAQASGRAAILQGYRVVYREAHTLLEELAEATLAGTRKAYLTELSTVPLLIIDDLGMRKLAHTAAEDLLELIMRRYERASTLLTSNRPVDD